MSEDPAQASMRVICSEEDPQAFRSVLERVANRWTLIVIGLVETESLRFTALLDAIPGISRRMLTMTLRALERDGLVERTVYAEVPARVEYRATELGVSLSEPVLALARWVDANKQEILLHRDRYDIEVERRNDA